MRLEPSLFLKSRVYWFLEQQWQIVWQLTFWIIWSAVVWRQDLWCCHWSGTVQRGVKTCGPCGPTKFRPVGCCSWSDWLLVLRKKEAWCITKCIGWHQLRLPLVLEVLIHQGPSLCSWVVLSWRSAGGIAGGSPRARGKTRSRFWGWTRGQGGRGGRNGCV